jgi:hypothetical protein
LAGSTWACPWGEGICLCGDAATCPGTPPVVCDGCCGNKYAADSCANGAWTCPPLKEACGICDAGTDAADSDASAGDANGEGTMVVIRFGANDECLPKVLPTDGATDTTCRIVLDSVVGGCQQPGLSPANSEDVAKIDAAFQAGDASPPPASMVCEVTQESAAATAGAGCANQAVSGWCYVQGSCPVDAGQHCQQDICTTPAFDSQHVVYGGAWLFCP